MSRNYQINCWQCRHATTLEERGRHDGNCWGCGAELDLETYLIIAQTERDQLHAEVEALRELAAECADYLDYNSMTNIASGSILHRKLRDAAIAAKEGA